MLRHWICLLTVVTLPITSIGSGCSTSSADVDGFTGGASDLSSSGLDAGTKTGDCSDGGSVPAPLATLSPQPPATSFGAAVSGSGDTVAVGAPSQSAPGAVFIYVKGTSGWTQQARLVASDSASGDSFGRSVALEGDDLVVGSASSDATCGPGAVYVLGRANGVWTQKTKLVRCAQGDRDFGAAVAISDDTILAGAPTPQFGDCNPSGAAYVFLRGANGWVDQARLPASEARECHFGRVLALDGDTAVIARHVFVRSGGAWSSQQVVVTNPPWLNDTNAVALSGDTAVFGAMNDSVTAIDAGAAYVFVRSGTTWAPQARLAASDANDWATFGAAVTLSDNLLVVGAPCDGAGNCGPGAAYVFERTSGSWSQTAKIATSSPAYFGTSVSFANHNAVVGAPITSTAAPSAAYVFGPLCQP